MAVQVARATVLAFSRTIPPAVPGVVFLSGGQVRTSHILLSPALPANIHT